MNRIFGCLLALTLFCVACQNDDNSGRFPVCVDGKWGYIDTTGAIVIKPKFDNASRFSEDLASVKIDGKYGYIDKRGRFIINPQFEAAGVFSEGLASVTRLSDGKAGYINMKGEYVIEPQFDDVAGIFVEGLAAVKIGDLYGYIDKTGKFVINQYLI